jgi:transposase InsO family protein
VIQENPKLIQALSVDRACRLLEVNRGSYYRSERAPAPARLAAPDVELRDAIERIVLAFSGYGYRRVTAQLHRDGWAVNHKRVLRVMRQECLLCQLKRRWVRTTNSEHGFRICPNLLPEAGWRGVTRPDEAWASDITYIRLGQQFVYLAVILDAFSRRVVGWCLSREIDASLTVTALDQALALRCPPAGWIHHSDRGVQYACRDYVARVEAAGGRVSMAAKGTPRENAQAESFMRTLKTEEVAVHEYATYEAVEGSIGHFIETVYNRKRLHSSIGHLPPVEFEEQFAAGIFAD